MAKRELLPRQIEFCEQMVKLKVIKKAWEAAGYKGPVDRAYSLLKDPRIKETIQTMKQEALARQTVDLEWFKRSILETLKGAISAKEYGSTKGLYELAARYHGIPDPPQRIELTGPGGGPIESKSVAMSINADVILSPRRVSDGNKDAIKQEEGNS